MPGAGGVLVEFYHHETEMLLWRAPMQYLPRTGDILHWRRVNDASYTIYSVERIVVQFDEPVDLLGEGFSTAHAQHTPVVYVKPGT